METTTVGATSAATGRTTSAYPTAEMLAVAQQKYDALIRRGVFRPAERFVCRDRDYEDRVQEGLAAGWRWYSQQVALGREPDVALAVHAVRLRMVDRTRRFVCGDRTRWRSDVYEAQGRDVELRRLDSVMHDDGDDDETREDQSLGLARLGLNNPEANVISELDLTDWLETLPTTEREMLELRGAGYGLAEIAKATARSVAGVSRRTRQLGEQLALRAGVVIPLDVSASRQAA